MSCNKNNWEKLIRKRFDNLMTDANIEYLFDRNRSPQRYPKGDEFNPLITPNRNPQQVPIQLWVSLLSQHLNNHFHN